MRTSLASLVALLLVGCTATTPVSTSPPPAPVYTTAYVPAPKPPAYVPDSSPSYDYAPSTGGTVHVKGYTRKDGTYVRPHTRRAPRRH